MTDPAPTLSVLQEQLAARPDDPQLIEGVRAETARVLGTKDVLPADGSPSKNQTLDAYRQAREIDQELAKLVPGSKQYMALIDQKIALSRVAKHEQIVEEAQQGTFTARDVDKAAEGVIPTESGRDRFRAAASHAGLTNIEAAQLLWDIGGADKVLLDPERYPETLDLDELWGANADENIKLVNGLLTQLRRHSQADHDALLPYVQRVPAVANRLAAIARRQRGAA